MNDTLKKSLITLEANCARRGFLYNEEVRQALEARPYLFKALAMLGGEKDSAETPSVVSRGRLPFVDYAAAIAVWNESLSNKEMDTIEIEHPGFGAITISVKVKRSAIAKLRFEIGKFLIEAGGAFIGFGRINFTVD